MRQRAKPFNQRPANRKITLAERDEGRIVFLRQQTAPARGVTERKGLNPRGVVLSGRVGGESGARRKEADQQWFRIHNRVTIDFGRLAVGCCYPIDWHGGKFVQLQIFLAPRMPGG